jgi:hypothetical protein
MACVSWTSTEEGYRMHTINLAMFAIADANEAANVAAYLAIARGLLAPAGMRIAAACFTVMIGMWRHQDCRRYFGCPLSI